MRRSFVCLCLVLATVLSGCGVVGQAQTKASGTPEKAVVSVAYLESDMAASAVVASFGSDGVEVLPVVIPTVEGFDDYLTHNNFPADVLLIPNTIRLSAAAYALERQVQDLSGLLPEILGDTEYYPVLDAGSIGGIQAFLPLRFQLPWILTEKEQPETFGLALPKRYDMKEFMEEFAHLAEACPEGTSVMYRAFPEAGIGGALYDALRLSGVWNPDPSTPGLVAPEAVFMEYAAYIKAVWEQTKQAEALSPHSISPWYSPVPVLMNEKILFLQGEGFLPEALTVYDAACQDGAVPLGICRYETPGALTADITLFAAVSPYGYGKNREAICQFLRHAFTTPEGQGGDWGLSVCREAAESCLEALCRKPEKVYASGPVWQRVPAMTQALREECEAMLDRIVSGSIRNAYWERVFSGAMADFQEGNASFESCLESLRQLLYEVPDEAGLTVKELVLSEVVQEEILREEAYPVCDLYQAAWGANEGKIYFGTFQGGVLFRNGSSMVSTQMKQLYGTVYVDGSSTDRYYRYGVFFDPVDAYKRGLLTEADVPVFAERFAQYGKRSE